MRCSETVTEARKDGGCSEHLIYHIILVHKEAARGQTQLCYHANNPIIWLISPSSVHLTQTTGNSIAPLAFVCVKYKQMDQKRIFPTGGQRLVQSAGATQWHSNLLVYGEIYCIKPPLNILCQSIFRPYESKVVLQLYIITKQH